MWPDNETEIDFLNFESVADTVAEVVIQLIVSQSRLGCQGLGESANPR